MQRKKMTAAENSWGNVSYNKPVGRNSMSDELHPGGPHPVSESWVQRFSVFFLMLQQQWWMDWVWIIYGEKWGLLQWSHPVNSKLGFGRNISSVHLNIATSGFLLSQKQCVWVFMCMCVFEEVALVFLQLKSPFSSFSMTPYIHVVSWRNNTNTQCTETCAGLNVTVSNRVSPKPGSPHWNCLFLIYYWHLKLYHQSFHPQRIISCSHSHKIWAFPMETDIKSMETYRCSVKSLKSHELLFYLYPHFHNLNVNIRCIKTN